MISPCRFRFLSRATPCTRLVPLLEIEQAKFRPLVARNSKKKSISKSADFACNSLMYGSNDNSK